jgi:hypothetical protein
VALMLGVSTLLAMAKDTNGLCPIAICEVSFDLLVTPLSYNFRGYFKNIFPPLVWSIDPQRL